MSDNQIILAADDTTAKALVDTIKASVNGAGKYAAYVTAHNVTRETVKDHARALAVFAYPSLPPVQAKDGVRTKFGNAVQAAAAGLRGALEKGESESVTNLLTKAGLKADLEDVIAAWKIANA